MSSLLKEIYITGLEGKLGYYPTKEDLRKDMIEQENMIDGKYGDRTIKFDLKIGKSHIVHEQIDFHTLEKYRKHKELKIK